MINRLAVEPTTTDPSADEATLLDLLNSTPVLDGVETDALAQWAQARDWMRQRSISPSKKRHQVLLQVRALLQDVVRGDAPPMGLSPIIEHVRFGARVADSGVQWHIEPAEGYEVAAQFVLSWDRLQRHSPGRLRPCANTECNMFLIDRSKPNTARWCSMAVCGNRMKARRYHERQRRR